MSQENVEIVRSVYERFSEADFRASMDLLDPHVVLVLGPEFAPNLMASPIGGAFYGIEAVGTYTRGFLEDQTVTMEAEEDRRGGRQRARGGASTRGRKGERRTHRNPLLHALVVPGAKG